MTIAHADNDYILICPFAHKIIRELTEKKPMKFLDMIKAANESKNKQAHRVTSNSKRGRQLLARSTKDIQQAETNLGLQGNDEQDSTRRRAGPNQPNSKADI